MNPQEAHSGGLDSEEAAAQLRDLPIDFDDLVESVQTAMDHEPFSVNWGAFQGNHVDHMETVKSHADAIAGNIQSAAEDTVAADTESSEEYNFPRPPNV